MCSLGGYPVFHYPKEEEDNVLMDNRPFYTLHKSITGRRAHNPIHPGGRQSQMLFCVVYGETVGGGSRPNKEVVL